MPDPSQIFVRERPDPYWFATVRKTVALPPDMPKDIRAVHVRDLARSRNPDRPEAWVLAKSGS